MKVYVVVKSDVELGDTVFAVCRDKDVAEEMVDNDICREGTRSFFAYTVQEFDLVEALQNTG